MFYKYESDYEAFIITINLILSQFDICGSLERNCEVFLCFNVVKRVLSEFSTGVYTTTSNSI